MARQRGWGHPPREVVHGQHPGQPAAGPGTRCGATDSVDRGPDRRRDHARHPPPAALGIPPLRRRPRAAAPALSTVPGRRGRTGTATGGADPAGGGAGRPARPGPAAVPGRRPGPAGTARPAAGLPEPRHPAGRPPARCRCGARVRDGRLAGGAARRAGPGVARRRRPAGRAGAARARAARVRAGPRRAAPAGHPRRRDRAGLRAAGRAPGRRTGRGDPAVRGAGHGDDSAAAHWVRTPRAGPQAPIR